MTETLKYIVRSQERKTIIWMTLVEFHCLTRLLTLGVLCMSVVPVACEYYVHKNSEYDQEIPKSQAADKRWAP